MPKRTKYLDEGTGTIHLRYSNGYCNHHIPTSAEHSIVFGRSCKISADADAPMRGRPMGWPALSVMPTFQSTPPRGGDVVGILYPPPLWYFNPRPLTGATPSSAQLPPERPISIHAPMRGRPGRWSGRLVQVQFQSTPPRGGDVPLLDIVGHQIDISIHAPIRGRQLPLQSCPLLLQFQSTLPYGGDANAVAFNDGFDISIHAPVWGRGLKCQIHH